MVDGREITLVANRLRGINTSILYGT